MRRVSYEMGKRFRVDQITGCDGDGEGPCLTDQGYKSFCPPARPINFLPACNILKCHPTADERKKIAWRVGEQSMPTTLSVLPMTNVSHPKEKPSHFFQRCSGGKLMCVVNRTKPKTGPMTTNPPGVRLLPNVQPSSSLVRPAVIRQAAVSRRIARHGLKIFGGSRSFDFPADGISLASDPRVYILSLLSNKVPRAGSNARRPLAQWHTVVGYAAVK